MKDKNLQSILCIIAGAVLVLFPYSALKWLMMALGVIILVYGISRINVQTGKSHTEGIIALLIGLFLIISPVFILGLLPVVLGIFILIYGITEIQKAVQKKKSGYSRWIPDLVIAILITLLGFSLVTNPFGLIKLLVKVAGVLVIYEGAAPLIRQNSSRY